MNDLTGPVEPDEMLRPGLRIHPPEIWDLARRDYLAGHSGPGVCARYGLGLAAFRKRAATGGWRRIDQPPPALATPIGIDGDLDEADYFDLAEMAAIHLREAVVNGRVTEAASWLRLHIRLHEASAEEFALGEAVRRDEIKRAAERAEVDGVDSIDGVFSAEESTLGPGTRPLSATGSGAESGRSGDEAVSCA